MKKRSKVLLLSLCAVLLVAASVLGTLAYLSSKDTAINTFTVGQVSITLDEQDVDDTDKDNDTSDRDKGNVYHLIPGSTYIKDPMVTVADGSEDSYVRMIMTVYNASAVQNIIDKHLPTGSDFSDLLVGWDENTWLYEDFIYDEMANTIRFEFRYKETVDGYDAEGNKEAEILDALFDKLLVPGGTTNAELKALEDGGFKIDVEAHAIQSAGFESDEDGAWEAFDSQNN